MRKSAWIFAGVLLAANAQLQGGTYLFSLSNDPFIIVHSPTYAGSSGLLTLSVCLDSGSPELESSLRWAIDRWNALTPTVNNCVAGRGGCVIAGSAMCVPPEPNPLPPDTYPCLPWTFDAGTILFHELGHCAFGLGHNNWIKNNGLGATTGFTATKDAIAMDDGTDNVVGSRDDHPVPNPGSRVVHWFRTSDNDPFLIDGISLNSSTYSRGIASLPSGSTWPASANVKTASLLGAGRAQALMQSVAQPNSDTVGLSADDVNTVKFAEAGLDPDLGMTGDDYTVQLVLVPSCATAQIEVRWFNWADRVGNCDGELEPMPIPGVPQVQHYRMVPAVGSSRLTVSLDSLLDPFQVWKFVVFSSGFDSGDTSGWDAVVP